MNTRIHNLIATIILLLTSKVYGIPEELERLLNYKQERFNFDRKINDGQHYQVWDGEKFDLINKVTKEFVPNPMYSGEYFYLLVKPKLKGSVKVDQKRYFPVKNIYFTQENIKNNYPFEHSPDLSILENLIHMSANLKNIDVKSHKIIGSIPEIKIFATRNSDGEIKYWTLDNRRLAQLTYIFSYWNIPDKYQMIPVNILSDKELLEENLAVKFNTQNHGRCVTFEDWEGFRDYDYLRHGFYDRLKLANGTICKPGYSE